MYQKGDQLVPVQRSREAIDIVLKEWGVTGIQWEDRFDSGISQLRFRWQRDDGGEMIARFRISVDSEERLREKAVDKRSGIFSKKKYNRIKASAGRKEHKSLLNLIRQMVSAITDGIMPAEALLLPWIEDIEGKTVYDKLAPRLSLLSTTPLHKTLESGDG